ncbi:hypothetical protein THAOC_02440 [Thalassiosira oceanica]|uniref:Uncharacterized protein n=1 Tax=Thalassiosira oceanica TaxID=159749 RepID=K0TAR1_THAOC|nr:hypothetical protein THAOC_02440 [Thalassiosira oceanica]|eukprot:EJK75828.1 hypothetical protein THAOC_02440 [Thalassiosira oceanica]
MVLYRVAISSPELSSASERDDDESNESASSFEQHRMRMRNATRLTLKETHSFWSSLILKGITCGEFKCLFREIDSSTGYLISSNYGGVQFEEECYYSWLIAKYVDEKFGAKHLFLEAPRRVNIPDHFFLQFANETIRKGREADGKPLYQADTDAVIQKVRLAPQPMKILTHGDGWTTFKWMYRKKAQDRASFMKNFQSGINGTMKVLENLPLLAVDWQVMLDAHGYTYQFDLDRAFCSCPFEKWKNCRQEWLHGGGILSRYNSSEMDLSCDAIDAMLKLKGRLGKPMKIERNSTQRKMMAELIQSIAFGGDEGTAPKCIL